MPEYATGILIAGENKKIDYQSLGNFPSVKTLSVLAINAKGDKLAIAVSNTPSLGYHIPTKAYVDNAISKAITDVLEESY